MIMGKNPISQLGLAFFGLTSDTILQSRASIFKQHTVYNMPIWLRRFTFNEIQKYYDEEKSAHDSQGKSGTQTVIGSDGKVKAPEFLQGAKGNRPAKYK